MLAAPNKLSYQAAALAAAQRGQGPKHRRLECCAGRAGELLCLLVPFERKIAACRIWQLACPLNRTGTYTQLLPSCNTRSIAEYLGLKASPMGQACILDIQDVLSGEANHSCPASKETLLLTLACIRFRNHCTSQIMHSTMQANDATQANVGTGSGINLNWANQVRSCVLSCSGIWCLHCALICISLLSL